jgi:alpha-L-fucosidase
VDRAIYSPYDHEPLRFGRVRYLPPECDVALRRHWFWQPDNAHTLKSRDHLLGVWYRTVGLGATLVLNIPADRRGRLDEADTSRLAEFADEVSRRFSRPAPGVLEGGRTLVFPEPFTLDHLVLAEDLGRGQRVVGHEIAANGEVIAGGGTIGVKRVHAFPEVRASSIEIRLKGNGGTLRHATGFHTGYDAAPELEPQPFMAAKMDRNRP